MRPARHRDALSRPIRLYGQALLRGDARGARQGHAADRRILQPREIDAVVKYLFAKAVGRGASTYEDCVDFWGQDTRQCDPMKK